VKLFYLFDLFQTRNLVAYTLNLNLTYVRKRDYTSGSNYPWSSVIKKPSLKYRF